MLKNTGVTLTQVMTAHLLDGAVGWFVGTVVTSAVGKSWKTGKNGVPTATNVVEFKLKDTGTKSLNGKVAMELSPAKYGADEWWLLLEPVES